MSTRPILGLMYMLKGLQQQGEDIAPVLEKYGLALERLDPTARIDRDLELQIHTDLGAQLRNPLAGLNSGPYFGFAGYGPLSMLLMTCADGLDAIRTGIRYQGLTYLYSTLEFEPGPQTSALILVPPALPRRAFRFRVDGEMSGTYKLLRDIQAAIGVDLKAERVDMPYPRPRDAAAYETHFGCPVTFGETQARFWIRNDYLKLPFPSHDAAAHALYQRLCDEQLQAQAHESHSLAQRVQQHLALYQDRMPDAARVSRLFGLPERSFRRQLSVEGTSFRALLARARFERAQQLLRTSGLSVEAVAERLGYSETAAFNHAFRRWAGMTPLAWRSSDRTGGGDGNRAQR